MCGSPGRRILVATVLSTLVVAAASTPPTAWASSTTYGHLSASDHVLRPGCHSYRYRYVVRPPSSDWMLETWLRDPRGRHRGSGDFAAGSDPRRGRASFGICRTDVVAGRFTIRARLSWWTPGLLPTEPPVRHSRWLKPVRPRLHR